MNSGYDGRGGGVSSVSLEVVRWTKLLDRHEALEVDAEDEDEVVARRRVRLRVEDELVALRRRQT